MLGGFAASTGSDTQKQNRNTKRIGALCAGEASGASFTLPHSSVERIFPESLIQ